MYSVQLFNYHNERIYMQYTITDRWLSIFGSMATSHRFSVRIFRINFVMSKFFLYMNYTLLSIFKPVLSHITSIIINTL